MAALARLVADPVAGAYSDGGGSALAAGRTVRASPVPLQPPVFEVLGACTALPAATEIAAMLCLCQVGGASCGCAAVDVIASGTVCRHVALAVVVILAGVAARLVGAAGGGAAVGGVSPCGAVLWPHSPSFAPTGVAARLQRAPLQAVRLVRLGDLSLRLRLVSGARSRRVRDVHVPGEELAGRARSSWSKSRPRRVWGRGGQPASPGRTASAARPARGPAQIMSVYHRGPRWALWAREG